MASLDYRTWSEFTVYLSIPSGRMYYYSVYSCLCVPRIKAIIRLSWTLVRRKLRRAISRDTDKVGYLANTRGASRCCLFYEWLIDNIYYHFGVFDIPPPVSLWYPGAAPSHDEIPYPCPYMQIFAAKVRMSYFLPANYLCRSRPFFLCTWIYSVLTYMQ